MGVDIGQKLSPGCPLRFAQRCSPAWTALVSKRFKCLSPISPSILCGSITTYPILTQRMPKSRHREEECAEDGIEHFERMPPDNPTGLLALANEYVEVGRHE